MKSFRIFLWPTANAANFDVLALEQSLVPQDPTETLRDWSAALASGQLRYIPAEAAESLEQCLQLASLSLPAPHVVHVFASPLGLSPAEAASLRMSGKKPIVIGPHTQLKDYQLIRDFLEASRPTGAEARERLALQITSLSDRVLEERIRQIGPASIPALRRVLGDSDRLERLIAKSQRPQRLLLHVCCGPDAAGVVRQLKSEFDLSCFWYDPNIQPQQEHDKRLHAFEKVMELEGIPYVVGEYDVDNFLTKIRGLEHTPEQGAKCSKCYDMRLERAAFEAREKGFDLYATTLAISPHKVQQKLVAFGELNEKRYGIPYFHRNFMKDDGFNDSVTYTREHDIFRQDYCGCWFSLHEGGPAAQWLGAELGLGANSSEAPLGVSEGTFQEYEARLPAASSERFKG